MTIIEPTLLLDKDKCLHNIRKMIAKAGRHGLHFRPHFKTHQSLEIGRWLRKLGVRQITVSSLKMAEYFATDGWQDITVAFPVNILEYERINHLAQKIKLNLLLESEFVVSRLADFLQFPVSVFIKIDAGYHRTGISADETGTIDAILDKISQSTLMTFKGFLIHSGNNYHASSIPEIEIIHNVSLAALQKLKERYGKDYQDTVLSIGDTPGCALMDHFEPATEIRPGTFVFYDLVQAQLGACTTEDIAIAMACPVVAKHPARNEIVFYGGAVHFSKDYLEDANGQKIYGQYVERNEDGWDKTAGCCYVTSLSQEHGILKACNAHFDKIQIGDLVHILPVHSCLTANLMKSYCTLEGTEISRV